MQKTGEKEHLKAIEPKKTTEKQGNFLIFYEAKVFIHTA